MKLLKATKQDISIVSSIIEHASEELKERGFSDWKNYYTEEKINELLSNYCTYIFKNEDVVIGTVTLNEEFPYYYTSIDKSLFINTQRIFVVSAFTIDPKYQGKGYGQKALKLIETLAKSLSKSCLIFDANSKDELLINFYLKAGYTTVGRMQEENDYLLFQKVL